MLSRGLGCSPILRPGEQDVRRQRLASIIIAAAALAAHLLGVTAEAYAQKPAGADQAIRQMEQWAGRLKSDRKTELSDAEKERLGDILKEARDWSPADKVRGMTTLVDLLTLGGARRLLLPGSGVYLSLIRDGLTAINEKQYQRYEMARKRGQSPEEAWTTGSSEMRANYEVRYQYARILQLLQQRTIEKVWKLEVADQTIDELWDKREYTYKVTNFSGERICDFSLILHNDKVKGDAAGEMIHKDSLVLPQGWVAQTGGNVIRFETNNPKDCIPRGQAQSFTFRVWWKNYNELGTVTASASILNRAGQHAMLPGSEIGEFYGPVAVAAEPNRPPEGSRIVLTGQVVEGQPALLTAVGPGGASLSGVVVDVGGQQRTTDESGRLLFVVPAGLTALAASFSQAGEGGPTAVSNVVRAPGASTAGPQITAAAPYTTPGGEMAISGISFSPEPGQTQVHLGGQELTVLAASPVEVVASVPAQMPLGDPGALVVSTPSGKSNPARVQVAGLRLQSDATKLVRGQRGKALVVVEGVTGRVPVRITNLSPSVIRLQGGESQVRTSSGGTVNTIPIEFQSVGSGSFQLEAALAVSPTTTSVSSKP